jgi:hypothetical protein
VTPLSFQQPSEYSLSHTSNGLENKTLKIQFNNGSHMADGMEYSQTRMQTLELRIRRVPYLFKSI